MDNGLLVIQSGGPTAVSNAGLVAAVVAATERLPRGSRVVGAHHGIRGLLEEDFVDLVRVPAERLRAIAEAPGAALGSSRFRTDDEGFGIIVEGLRRMGLRMILVMGGNGSMAAARRLAEVAAEAGFELAVAGIPFTVDNDVGNTDFCLGFPSAARYYAQAVLDLSADVESLPTPVSVLEVMGRNSGWLTASTVLARRSVGDAPHRVYVPESPLSQERLITDVDETYRRHGWVVVSVAEGLCDETGGEWAEPFDSPRVGDHGGRMLGDAGARLARLVTRETGLRARCEKPGLLARAAPRDVSDVDRRAAVLAADFAVGELAEGRAGFMTAMDCHRSDSFSLSCRRVPLAMAEAKERPLPREFLDAAGRQPNESFKTYARPLMGGSLRRYEAFAEQRRD